MVPGPNLYRGMDRREFLRRGSAVTAGLALGLGYRRDVHADISDLASPELQQRDVPGITQDTYRTKIPWRIVTPDDARAIAWFNEIGRDEYGALARHRDFGREYVEFAGSLDRAGFFLDKKTGRWDNGPNPRKKHEINRFAGGSGVFRPGDTKRGIKNPNGYITGRVMPIVSLNGYAGVDFEAQLSPVSVYFTDIDGGVIAEGQSDPITGMYIAEINGKANKIRRVGWYSDSDGPNGVVSQEQFISGLGKKGKKNIRHIPVMRRGDGKVLQLMKNGNIDFVFFGPGSMQEGLKIPEYAIGAWEGEPGFRDLTPQDMLNLLHERQKEVWNHAGFNYVELIPLDGHTPGNGVVTINFIGDNSVKPYIAQDWVVDGADVRLQKGSGTGNDYRHEMSNYGHMQDTVNTGLLPDETISTPGGRFFTNIDDQAEAERRGKRRGMREEESLVGRVIELHEPLVTRNMRLQ